jgi:hypothetical protein
MRVYVPSTLPSLTAWAEAGLVEASRGYAVTPALREWYAGGDDEELEYAALTQAARASIGLIAGSSGTVPRRVVVACDIDPLPPAGSELGDASVTLAGPVAWSEVAAVHVDAVEAGPVIAAAVAVWDAAQNGDEDATFAVEACEGEELLWYATQEVADLVALDGETRRRRS